MKAKWITNVLCKHKHTHSVFLYNWIAKWLNVLSKSGRTENGNQKRHKWNAKLSAPLLSFILSIYNGYTIFFTRFEMPIADWFMSVESMTLKIINLAYMVNGTMDQKLMHIQLALSVTWNKKKTETRKLEYCFFISCMLYVLCRFFSCCNFFPFFFSK